ncbi:MAG: insulinase family protein [Halioglobus sp.]|nr:insulinase family protein [Halioglobus sp.]
MQSENDKYGYRLLTLPNELEVLLISAPDSPKAAASLAVMVGSGDNPPGRGGLAHFLEHMLFLGTDKYPDAAEYEEYITEHGGMRNAYTSFDHTNYFFDINAEHLPEALDRFAQFFISPRFDAVYVDREKQAVEAEYQMGLKSDGRRNLDVLQEVMNPQHPYSQFSVGSLETLADREDASIRDELISFYNTHYSANIMRLAVLGNESLDELEALVTPMFSEVPNKAFTHEDIEAPLFDPQSLPKLVQVQPLATLRELEVAFPIPDYRDAYRAKPVSYIGNLVGHEGAGSLLSLLKSEGLAESQGAGGALAWRGGSLFSVNISLTEKGAAQHDRVLQLVFAYLDMLREKGPQDWLYEEQSQLADLSFRFREPGNPASYVTALANGMHYYEPRDVLRGAYMMSDYDQAMLADLMGYLRPDNALVMFSDAAAETDTVSRYYATPYSQAPLDTTATSAAPDDPGVAQLQLPPPNEFIAEDLSLVALPQPVPDAPSVALEQGRQTIWYMADDEFRVPRGAIYVNFRSGAVGRTARQAALTGLYTAVLTDDVNEFSYPARLAGLQFGFYKQIRGIGLRLSGYNDKQLLLLEHLVDELQQPRFDAERFENIRLDLVRALQNAVAERPSSQVMNDLSEALLYGQWGEQALIAELETVTLQELLDFATGFWRDASAEVLVFGNYERSTVKQVSSMLSRLLSSEPAQAPVLARVLKLAPGESLQYAVDVPHDDSVVAWYLQGAGDSWNDRAATALTAQIIKSGFFQQLRTEQQLGYVVAAFNWPQKDVPGLVMLIQSPREDAAGVADAMDAFMQRVSPTLTEAQFARHSAALVSEIMRPDKNLNERAEFYWSSIARKRYDFDGRETLAAAVEALTLDDWRDYYTRVFLNKRHSLQVVAPGRFGVLPPAGEGQAYTAAEQLKQGRDVYELH